MVSEKDRAPPSDQPAIVIEQEHALQAVAAQETTQSQTHHHAESYPERVEDVPPPPYDAPAYGQLDIIQNGLDTGAQVGSDGRVNIKITEKSRRLTNLLAPALRQQFDLQQEEPPAPKIPEGLGFTEGLPPPPMNIVIQIVGSRGDVQPFIALGQVLKNKFNHRVRIATHPTFRDFVQDNGLEFFSIGGDPAELMAFMVKNPGLMPGIESLRNGDIGKRRKGIYEIIKGCWRSCIETGDGTGIKMSDDVLDDQSFASAIDSADPTMKPFIADAIIANPPSFAHVHIAEKLGVPLHLMFTMPWSPTQMFPHPLANVISANTDPNFTNFISYALVDMLTWQGLGDIINRFRERTLHLEPMSIIWAPGITSRLRIPWTYCWSPALIPKPKDWGSHIDISGFYFLNLATNYTPPPDLAAFLEAGSPPVYIGFGSIVVDDPNAMTTMIFEAVKKSGQRALVSKGWGGLGADELGVPEGVFMLGNCPHDWLFKKVSCVVHHGGAGTTAAGIAAGRPTIVVPFFGDQKFWGSMTARAGAGPDPIPYKELTADKLAEAIKSALLPASLERAQELSDKIKQEEGADTGADSFHKHMNPDKVRCHLCPGRVAVWHVKRTNIHLSALAATVLANEGLLEFSDLRLFRACEYDVDQGPPEPISGGASALIGTLSNLSVGIADMPVEVLRSVKSSTKDRRASGHVTSPLASASTSSTDLASSSHLSAVSERTESRSSPDENPSSAASASMSRVSTVSDTENAVASSSESSSSHHRQSSMSTILAPDGSSRRYSRSRSRSRSGTPRGARDCSPAAREAGQITLDSAIETAKASGRLVGVGLKSPMDFTLSLAKGFHNAPKLYGDDTVRKAPRVTGFQSGLKAAGKEFGFGFYDGITGLVTQPIRGAQKEGAAGAMKGLMKGAFGLVLKPGASIWGLPGYAMKGIYAEIAKVYGSGANNYIIAARTTEGYADYKQSSAGDRERICQVWKRTKIETKGKKKALDQKGTTTSQSPALSPVQSTETEHEDVLSGFSKTRHMTFDQRKEYAARKEALKKQQKKKKSSAAAPSKTNESLPTYHEATNMPTAGDDEFEEAIVKSVNATSRGNPHEDAKIESAIRASVAAMRGAPVDEDDDAAYHRAIQASIAEAQGAHEEDDGDSHETGHSIAMKDNENLTEDEAGTEDDEEFIKAVEESKRLHTERREKGLPIRPTKVFSKPPPLPARGTGTEQDSMTEEEEEQFRRALMASMQHNDENTKTNDRYDDDDEDDEDLRKAITESEQHSKQKEAALEKARTEEDIVLEYIKKQSLLEEEHRKKMAAKDLTTREV